VGIDIRQRLFFPLSQNTDGVIGLDIICWLGIILMLLAWLLALHWYIESGIGLGLHRVCLFVLFPRKKGPQYLLLLDRLFFSGTQVIVSSYTLLNSSLQSRHALLPTPSQPVRLEMYST